MINHSAPTRCAIGYVRVSTDEQTDNYSIDVQRASIKAWCQQHHIPLGDIIDAEQGESAKDLHRSGIKRLQARLTAGDVGWVVVYRVDRLSRSLKDTCELLHHWDKQHIQLVAPGDGHDSQFGCNRFVLYLNSWIAEEERRRILTRVRPGLAARARAGLPLGRPPLGYCLQPKRPGEKNPAARDYVFAPDPQTAPLIEAVFKQAALSRWGARRLAKWATQQFPHQPWSSGQIAGILKNPVYCGTLIARVVDAMVVNYNNHTPLIEEDLFLQVQALVQQRALDQRTHLRDEQAISFLGGLARCGHCQRVVTVKLNTTTGERKYVCRSRLMGASCGAPVWPANDMDAHVLDRMYFKMTQDLASTKLLVDDAIVQLPNYNSTHAESAHRIIKNFDRDQTEFVMALETGMLAPEQAAGRHAQLTQRHTAAKATLQETEGYKFLYALWQLQNSDTTSMNPAVQALLPATHKQRRWIPLPLIFSYLTNAEKRKLIRALFPKIVLKGQHELPEVIMATGVNVYADFQKALSLLLAKGHGWKTAEIAPQSTSK